MSRKKRKSPTPEEIQRIVEAINNQDTFHKIHDYDSFIEAYDGYFEEASDASAWDDDDLKLKAFGEYSENYADERFDNTIPGSPAAKQKRARRKAVSYPSEGFDTIGKSRGRIVYVRKDSYFRKGKQIGIYRDKRGRFARKG